MISSTRPLTASSWHSATVDKRQSLAGISCGSTHLCVAVDQVGNVLTSTKPTAGERAWRRARIDSAPLNAISCRPKLCVAVDNAGNVLSTTNPTGGARAWSIARLRLAALTHISCPSAGLCVALDSAGDAVSTTSPMGGAPAWTVTPAIDPAGIPTSLSCPSATTCVVGDDQGNVLVGST